MSNEIKIGGKPYIAKYTYGAYVSMWEKHGVNVFNIGDNPNPRMLAVLIWGAVIHIDPLITVDDIIVKLSMEEAMLGNRVCSDLIVDGLNAAKST